MSNKNPRINVTFDASIAGAISELAHQEHKSVSSLVRELTMEALEKREDFLLSDIASKRELTPTKMYSHEEAWH
ncbi:MAG: hypothetical protein K2X94_05055 [Amoebophilaceae bacterium]|nr:hypothetical protein [Amoebophilaceae bacterium]